MDSFFFIDKPQGITSFDVLREMKKKLGIKKLWHTGTLDPLATWWMLVATWSYTKLISYIDKEKKSYIATITLDGVSPSYDRDTEVSYISNTLQQKYKIQIEKIDIENLMKEHFLWKISQIPPKYSALKIDGKRALERVKAGENIEMKARETEVYTFKILSYSYPKLEIELDVQAGTYIRSIAHDLWQLIWCGGYISELRRSAVGSLNLDNAVTLEELNVSSTLNLSDIFPDRIHVFKDERIYRRLSDGQRVRSNQSFPENTDIFLFDGEVLRYVIEYKDGVIHPRKKICTP